MIKPDITSAISASESSLLSKSDTLPAKVRGRLLYLSKSAFIWLIRGVKLAPRREVKKHVMFILRYLKPKCVK